MERLEEEIEGTSNKALENDAKSIFNLTKQIQNGDSTDNELAEYILEVEKYFENVQDNLSRENQQKYIDELAKNGVVDILCRTFLTGGKSVLPDSTQITDGSSDDILQHNKDLFRDQVRETWEQVISIIMNATDCSPETAKRFIEFEGMPDFIKTTLESWLGLLKDGNLVNTEKELLYMLCCIISNCCALWTPTVGFVRNAGMVPILKEVNETGQLDDLHKMGVIGTITDIMDEKESSLIIDDEAIASFIVHLDQATKIPGLQCYRGWHSFEYGRVIRQLASFDGNKLRLVNLGALEVLIKLAKVDDETCQIEASSALGHLSFDPEAQNRMIEKDDIAVIPTLIDLATSSTYEKVRESARGTLWMMNAKLRTHKTYGKLVEQLFSKKARGHVMISYSREQRHLLLEIKRTLEKHGFTVWMDVDQMRGDVYDRMAEAVENAAVVMMGMSRTYKMSEYCRREAAYAKQLNKQILPLKVEKGYSPDGWLGIMTAGMFFYDFASKSFDEMATKLVKELNLKVCMEENSTSNTQAPVSTETHGSYTPVQMHGSDVPDSESLVTRQSYEKLHVSDGYKKFRDMDKISFLKWLDTACLPRDKFETFRPKDILYLATMRVEAPEAYYSLGRRLFKDKTNPFKKTQIMADLTEALNKLLLTMK